MQSYPARNVSTPDTQVNVLQISDLHLSALPDFSNNELGLDLSAKHTCLQGFEACLQQALSENIRCDLILITGDLVHEIQPATYDYIFKVLSATQIPFACIAGNHDVTDELGQELPFFQRELVAQSADCRLLSRHVIDTEHWQLLLLDSAVPGQVGGEVTNTDIEWLCTQLSTCNKPALVALHHHVIPMNSDWIDKHIAVNADTFWQRMQAFAHLRVIISGHTHQEQVRHYYGVTVYTTPSTCYQFQPNEDDFAYDECARPGYRWLQLANNGQVASWVKRLDT
ncbi:3',5'-cyclic-nucleotide phosphodiesterase [Psychrobacter frigidicola]|uniref:3',5'-cyclic-nucleotide phosphodiesterase n=1 Tax=Psychrobacter frigidicola TaxID=45611 RepID=A0A5C7A064_9GAMM|nr:metallophosphoesterase [Psychrobacter frigidicola]TXD96194.1 3',5'-cyclic-nucleotide phosphodiesterase [Psychrobacter frigidicola]